MKRTLLLIISIFIIIFVILLSLFYKSKDLKDNMKQFNLKYESFSKREEIYGRDIATLINQAVDDNELNKYKETTEQIDIQIRITDFEEGKIYDMKTLYGGGMNEFVKYYGDIQFKCIKTEYGKNGQVKYILFEQIKS